MPQVLKTLSQLLESRRATLSADDLAVLSGDVRGVLVGQKILVPSRPATHVKCDACHDDHVEEVTRIKDGKGVAFRIPCPDAGWVDVPEERLRQWIVDVHRLVAILSASVGSGQPPDELIRGVAWWIGTIVIAAESYNVVFVCSGGSIKDSCSEELGRKHPPARTIIIGIRNLPNDTAGFAASLTLPTAFMFVGDHIEFQLDGIRSIISAQSIVDGNVFQLRGEFWQLSFEGETTYLKDSVGLGYIARLLVEPHREIPAISLLAARAGIDPLIATGSSGELLDKEARNNYRRRYQELQENLEEARENRNLAFIEKLETEMEHLTNELARTIDVRGNPRKKYDADKVRKSVSEAVRRAVEKIEKKHTTLGHHLLVSISSGLTFRYAPEHDLDWLT